MSTSAAAALGTPTANRKALALDLKRSNKVDFSRERSFVQFSRRNNKNNGVLVQQQHHAAVVAAANRGKPTLEIYRPPSLRLGPAAEAGGGSGGGDSSSIDSPRLNVHAKEFTMVGNQQQQHHGNNNNNHHPRGTPTSKPSPLQQSFSIGNILTSNRVHFQDECTSGNVNSGQGQVVSGRYNSKSGTAVLPGPIPGLQRSKSMGAADMTNREPGVAREAPDLGIFPGEVLASIRRAVTDPNQMTARSLMSLVRQILQRVTESARYGAPAAKLCITIIEKEQQETFLESLLNTCTQWYQERDRHLRNSANPAVLLPGAPAPSCPRWVSFMTFLNEMYCQLKRRQLQLRTKPQGISPEMLLLGLLYDSCHVCLRPPAVNSLGETECLFFVLTSIGRDLDSEMAMRMPNLMAALRDAFLTASQPGVRKTLLQLIEMRAARWQLPAPAVMYYYPGSGAIK